MKIIRQIFESGHFENRPPVLIDIGASGEIHAKWQLIAPYSVCVAFDADDRDFQASEQTNKGFKKLITLNRIVTADASGLKDFYLTASPYCSSLLEPDKTQLEPWVFRKLFEVESVKKLPAITLQAALQQAGLSYIDWFKSDTQGTDLRLFKSVPEQWVQSMLVAEFEPGIMNAYKGEDKLYKVMETMEQGGFWLSSMEVKGTQRLHENYVKEIGPAFSKRIIRRSPCWAEVTYLRQPFPEASQRDFLLLYVFALLEYQYGFALEVADKALTIYNEPVFQECRQAIHEKIRSEKWKAPLVILKRQINKLFSPIHD